MPLSQDLKVSYCTTCMGRLHHLRKTLPQNLEAEKDNPNVEFIILSYGKDAALDDFMRDNYMDEIKSGRIKYVVYPEATHFKMAHAKNMAHRMASGDILVNLDADNLISSNFAKWLSKTFAKEPHQIITHHPVSPTHIMHWHVLMPIKGRIEKRSNDGGLGGRITVSKEDFISLNGYDEKYSNWGPDDSNFCSRAVHEGLKPRLYPLNMHGSVMLHDNAQRIENLSLEDQQKTTDVFKKFESNEKTLPGKIKRKFHNIKENYNSLSVDADKQTNKEGDVGCGAVYINFADKLTQIEPLKISQKHSISNEEKDDYTSSLKSNWAAEQEMNAANGIPPIRYR